MMISKSRFPFFDRFGGVYLDSASTTQKPKEMIDSLCNFYGTENISTGRSMCGLGSVLQKKLDLSRGYIAKFLGTTEDNLVFTGGATNSLNILSRGLQHLVNSGDNVVITEIEHHSNLLVWKKLCDTVGATLRVIKVDDSGMYNKDDIALKIDGLTKIVSFSGQSNVLGCIMNFEDITNMSKDFNFISIMDGSQYLSHKVASLESLNIDFVVGGAHKIYGPLGLGILYGKDLSLLRDLDVGGGTVSRVDSIDTSNYYSDNRRYESGTQDIASIISFGESCKFLMDTNFEENLRNMKEISNNLESRLRKIEGLKFVGEVKERNGILSFNIEGVNSLDLAEYLSLNGVCLRQGHHCCGPLYSRFQLSGAIRLSLGIYSDLQDVEAFMFYLKEALKKLRSTKQNTTENNQLSSLKSKYRLEKTDDMPDVDFDKILGIDEIPTSVKRTNNDYKDDVLPKEGDIISAIRTVIDPELNINLYDLGLIYKISITTDSIIEIEMTMTSPMCPIADKLPVWVADAIVGLSNVREVEVKVVWDPSWSIDKMSKEAKFELDIYN
ncbi:MAG: aminotransferase class V-fold PLP-dependent enzyme [Alphaproteobacteria bacterium]|nr:aminotransferase class V-fold PLP-dependent enzyme [Alphaproteobacteria bacterium]